MMCKIFIDGQTKHNTATLKTLLKKPWKFNENPSGDIVRTFVLRKHFDNEYHVELFLNSVITAVFPRSTKNPTLSIFVFKKQNKQYQPWKRVLITLNHLAGRFQETWHIHHNQEYFWHRLTGPAVTAPYGDNLIWSIHNKGVEDFSSILEADEKDKALIDYVTKHPSMFFVARYLLDAGIIEDELLVQNIESCRGLF